MKFGHLLLLILLLSCGKKKTVLLPEITHSEITEVNDLSPAYLFYDETLPDRIELNRTKLIGSTNWLVNVDKRLTLEQAIPKIIFLQKKKRNMKMHRNENAKNYYTCNDISIKNLGFIDFTNVFYHLENSNDNYNKTTKWPSRPRIDLHFDTLGKIELTGVLKDFVQISSNKNTLKTDIENLVLDQPSGIDLTLNFAKDLTFQDYISLKSIVLGLKSNAVTIDQNEFIY